MPLLRQTSTPRAAVFVILSFAGFVAANAFFSYLCTGNWLELSPSGFRKACAAPLAGVLLHPLKIFNYPWMMAVLAVLVGLMIFVPTMLAVLYRLWVAVLFILPVALVAHAPLMALTLLVAALAASQTRLRSNFPFLALLVGLVPVGVYIYLFGYFNLPTLAGRHRFVLYLPLTSALAVALLAGVVVLSLTRVTHYRPGVMFPVLTVLLAVPLILFYAKVGDDELDYCLLIEQAGMAGGEPIVQSETVEQFARRCGKDSPGSMPSSAGAPTTQPAMQALLAEARTQLDRRRRGIIRQCEAFLARHADSDKAAAVLWIRASVMDLQIDVDAFARGQIKADADVPTSDSIQAWNDLNDRVPGSPQAMVARQRLGIMALRDLPEPRVRAAYDHLHPAQEILRKYVALAASEVQPSGRWSAVFVPLEPLPERLYYRDVLKKVDHILWLMRVANVQDGPPENAQAFAEYMRHWPFRSAGREELLNLAQRYEKTPVGEDFRFQAAMAGGQELQIQLRRAKDLSAIPADSHASVAANYELGRLALLLGNTPAWRESNLKPAATYFQAVVSAPDSPYALPAREHLSRLNMPKDPPVPE